MYNVLNPVLMFVALAVPFVCLCKNVRQKRWPIVFSLMCGVGCLIWRSVLLALRVRWAG